MYLNNQQDDGQTSSDNNIILPNTSSSQLVKNSSTTASSSSGRFGELPREIIAHIFDHSDPRTLVNIICACKAWRSITIQLLLSGKKRNQYKLEGVPIRSSSIRMEAVLNGITLPNVLLDSYLEFLMKEEEDWLEMERLNLSCFENLTKSDMKKVAQFINQFKIDELIVNQTEEMIDWINNNLNSLPLTKLSLVLLEGRYFSYCAYFSQENGVGIPKIPLKVLNSLSLNEKSEIDRFCSNTVNCSTFEELTIVIPNTLFDYAFAKVLEKCINLREFEIRVHHQAKRAATSNIPILLEINEETVKIMKNCTKLEELRLDSFYDPTVGSLTLNCMNMDGIFPNLKVYSNSIPFNHPIALIPKHFMKSISVGKLNGSNREITFPKCDTMTLYQPNCIPTHVECRKLEIFNGNFHAFERPLWDILSSIPDLKELYLHDNFVLFSPDHILKSKLHNSSIEKLVIEKGKVEMGFLIQLLACSPNLKELYLKKVKVLNSDFVGLNSDAINRRNHHGGESNLKLLHLSGCSIEYSTFLEEFSKQYSFPQLKSIVLENAYSVTAETLDTLIQKSKNLSNLIVSGVEFNNQLIGKYLECNKYNNHQYGIDLAFNGKEITLEYLKNIELIGQTVNFSLPDCIIDNNEMISVLDKMSDKSKLLKIQINLGKSGPTIELFQKLQEFNNLQLIYLNGKPETKIEGFEEFILNDFLICMPNLRLLLLQCGEFSKDAIENAKQMIRLNGQSAPKLIIPMEKGSSHPFEIINKKQSDKNGCILN